MEIPTLRSEANVPREFARVNARCLEPRGRGRVVAREAEEVDRGDRQKRGVPEEVGVVLHVPRDVFDLWGFILGTFWVW